MAVVDAALEGSHETPQLQPPPLPPAALNVDDAFNDDDEDDNSYVFSRDSARKEFERNLPPPLDLWDTDTGSEHTASSTGALFTGRSGASSSHNHYANGGAWTSPTAESPLPSHFSVLSLSGSVDHHVDDEEDLQQPAASERPTEKESEEEAGFKDHPYPSVFIDASKDAVDRLSTTPEHKPHSPPNLPPEHSEANGTTTSAENGHGNSTPFVVPVLLASASSVSIPPSRPETARSSSSGNVVSTTSLPEGNTSNLLYEKPRSHKPNRSIDAGPSMFEKVRSRTRPTFLPPKSKEEDNKHLSAWQNMMKQSRLAAEKRRKALQDRRLAREKAIEENLARWEAEIVPDWKVVYKNPALRRLWWQGIPTKLRATMWEKAVGNPLALNKDHFRACLSRAKRALSAGAFPPESLQQLEQDVKSTLPALHIFHPETGPLYEDLKQILYAWVVARADEGLGYVAGAAKVAAMLLINMPTQNAFLVMRNLLDRHCLRSFFGGERTKDDVEAYYRIFDTLLADGMPKIYFNFKQHQISPSAYLPDWIVPLFLDHLPFEACARIWDVLLLEGDAFLYRAALGMLAVLEPRLFFPERKELLELLKGENRAALEVAKREGMPLDGGKYEIYGVDEESLWDRIDHMDDWWKESTWTRLIQRELPDA
ncbi:TBC1 domain family member 14 [Coprinopsis sp. MPI-PUGE-AT-0042]|nr:TBC1 domain family member 14 [Coprinopsis sp. MPI-PUGE-AT-0042]